MMAKPGRPRRDVSSEAVAALRARGLSWREIASVLGVGVGTVRRAHQRVAKTVPKLSPHVGQKEK